MANLLTDFIETFDKITHLYGEILVVSKKKQSLIIANDLNGLEMAVQRESNLLEKVILLEKKRLTLQKSLTEKCNIKERKLTINDIIMMLEDPQRDQLRSTYNKISKTINELQEVNEINRSLTKYSLDLTNRTIELFCIGTVDSRTYQNTGQYKSTDLTRVMIDTAA